MSEPMSPAGLGKRRWRQTYLLALLTSHSFKKENEKEEKRGETRPLPLFLSTEAGPQSWGRDGVQSGRSSGREGSESE